MKPIVQNSWASAPKASRMGLMPLLRKALAMAPGVRGAAPQARSGLVVDGQASRPVQAAVVQALHEDIFSALARAAGRAEGLQPAEGAAHALRAGRAAQGLLASQGRAARAGGAVTRALAAQFLLADAAVAPQLTKRLMDAGWMTSPQRQQVLGDLSRSARQIDAQARLRAAAWMAEQLPLKVAIFLAQQRLAVSRATTEMLLSWGESLREQAKLEKDASERAHRKAFEEARQRKGALETKLRLAHRDAALGASLGKPLDVAGVQAIADRLDVGQGSAASAAIEARGLINPPGNRFLLGAFCQPVAMGFVTGGSQSAYTRQILSAGLSA